MHAAHRRAQDMRGPYMCVGPREHQSRSEAELVLLSGDTPGGDLWEATGQLDPNISARPQPRTKKSCASQACRLAQRLPLTCRADAKNRKSS